MDGTELSSETWWAMAGVLRAVCVWGTNSSIWTLVVLTAVHICWGEKGWEWWGDFWEVIIVTALKQLDSNVFKGSYHIVAENIVTSN